MKKQKYTSQELGLISLSYMKGLFPKPTSKELLNDQGDPNGDFTFYYDDNYFTKYCTAFKEAYNSGAFARSNSEADWNNLMTKVLSAQSVNIENTNSLEEYFLTEK